MELFYDSPLRGVTFSPAKENLIELGRGFKDLELTLKHMPDNKYDKFAIAVMCENKQIGWIPKEYNYNMVKYGVENLVCVFKSYTLFNLDVSGVDISVYGKL